jgi:L-alanine-DL-glutamate epimerase-like enolase superfamily enzyme
MKIKGIETLRLGEFPNLLWVRVHTDEGLRGLGETYFGARAVEAWIHESAAPRLLGSDPLQIERIAKDLQPYVGFDGGGVETRGRSAIDVALWDLFGHATGQPVHQLLGGLARDRIWTYNTCAGYRYVRSRPDWKGDDWGLGGEPEGPYEDLDAFLNRADELAESLLGEGIRGMKIWPFDFTEGAAEGYHISDADLGKALEPFEKIRAAVGTRIDIMVELHSLWRFPAALKIAKALEPFEPYWYEDPVRMDSLPALARFAESTRVPVCASETVATRWNHRDLLETGAPAIVMPDIVWCGGLTEAKKVAAIADAYHRPVAPHDCTGPVAFAAAVHLSLNVPNALVQESVRAFYTGWYRELVTVVPRIQDGYVYPMEGPGLGTDLRPEIWERSDASTQLSGSL